MTDIEDVKVEISVMKLDSIIGYAINGLNPRIDFKPNHSENILNAYHETRQCLASILAILEKVHPSADAVMTIKNQMERYCTYGYREGTHD